MEKEENEEAEEEEEEDEGALQVDCHRTLLWWRFCLCTGSSVSVFKIVLKPCCCVSEAKMSLAAARPLIGVHSDKNAPTGTTVRLPAVFRAPVRWAAFPYYVALNISMT